MAAVGELMDQRDTGPAEAILEMKYSRKRKKNEKMETDQDAKKPNFPAITPELSEVKSQLAVPARKQPPALHSLSATLIFLLFNIQGAFTIMYQVGI